MSIYRIINNINSSLSGLITGAEWLGVASSATRDNKTQPVIDEKPAGFDDKYPIRSYHKLGTLTSRLVEGFGRTFDQSNTYTNSMVVFINRNRCKLYPDEVLLAIQANIPESIKMEPYRQVNIAIARTDLDSETVFSQEYKGGQYKLKEGQYLIKINYTVETIFKKGCFASCERPQN